VLQDASPLHLVTSSPSPVIDIAATSNTTLTPSLTASSPHVPSSSLNVAPIDPIAPTHHVITCSQTGNLKPKSFPDFKLFRAVKHPFLAYHTLTLPPEPSTYHQAATKPEWVDAMSQEFHALLSNQTWSLCPRPLH
jgi:hypothetical protein